MTWKSQGPPDGTQRTLKFRLVNTQFNNTEQNNGSARQIQAPSIGSTAAQTVADLNFRRNVEHMHSLGARVVGELLAELGAERGIQTIIDQKVGRYAAIDPHQLTASGGDRFARPPLTVVTSADDEPAA